MPKVTLENGSTIEVESGTKLVLAIEDSGVDILHRCGGNSRCTTCRVEILEGSCPEAGEAEAERLSRESDLPSNVRLSCQVRVSDDMRVKVLSTATSTGMPVGPRPAD